MRDYLATSLIGAAGIVGLIVYLVSLGSLVFRFFDGSWPKLRDTESGDLGAAISFGAAATAALVVISFACYLVGSLLT